VLNNKIDECDQKKSVNNNYSMERRYYYGKRDFSQKCSLQSMSLIIDGMYQGKYFQVLIEC
jgi:hypothetical protein